MGNLSVNLAERVGKYLVESGSRLHMRPQGFKIDPKGLKLATLEADTVQLSKTAGRWSGAAENYIPTVCEGSEVAMHHALNGSNSTVRGIIRDIESGRVNVNLERRYFADDFQDILKTDKEFAKLPPLEKDCIVYRGRVEQPQLGRANDDFKIVQNAQIDEIIVPDLGYSYTGFNSGACDAWGRTSSKTLKTMAYEIRLPKGAKVSRNLEHRIQHGGEVVMPRGAEYRLISKKTNGNHTDVVLEYILPTKDNVAEIEGIMRKYNIPLTPAPKVKTTKQTKPKVHSDDEVSSFMRGWTTQFDK